MSVSSPVKTLQEIHMVMRIKDTSCAGLRLAQKHISLTAVFSSFDCQTPIPYTTLFAQLENSSTFPLLIFLYFPFIL